MDNQQNITGQRNDLPIRSLASFANPVNILRDPLKEASLRTDEKNYISNLDKADKNVSGEKLNALQNRVNFQGMLSTNLKSAASRERRSLPRSVYQLDCNANKAKSQPNQNGDGVFNLKSREVNSGSGNSETYFRSGNVLYTQGDYDKAIGQYKQALGLNAKDSRVYYQYGNALFKQNKHREAEEKYTQAIDLDHDGPIASNIFNMLGNALAGQGKYSQAAKEYSKAIDLDPKNYGAYYNWGVALYYQNEYVKATEKFNQFFSIAPDYVEAPKLFGYALISQKECYLAEEIYSEAANIDKNSDQAISNLEHDRSNTPKNKNYNFDQDNNKDKNLHIGKQDRAVWDIRSINKASQQQNSYDLNSQGAAEDIEHLLLNLNQIKETADKRLFEGPDNQGKDINKLKSHITYESELEKGSELTFSRPLDLIKAQQKILNVNDDEFGHMGAKLILPKFGYQIDLASNGQEAIDVVKKTYLYEKGGYRLILMNLQMPIMDGFEATKKLIQMMRKKEIPTIPIVATSVNDDQETIEKCMQHGMYSFLPLPLRRLDFEKLLNSLEESNNFS